eukprot:TRINITY_DN2925_c0_g2_i1.p2 TRINITY_DN2925_c0_g2~~TRINITY_DN2925_c0_g2_i1.p2  ORF type:complete len:250 (+),score=16.98 TRINITY_DN2925_c0_g2_i1:928-1677(+)
MLNHPERKLLIVQKLKTPITETVQKKTTTLQHQATTGFHIPSYCHYLSTSGLSFTTGGPVPIMSAGATSGGATSSLPNSSTTQNTPVSSIAFSTTSPHYPIYNGTVPPGQGIYVLPNGELISCSPPVPPSPPPVTGCEYDTAVQHPDYVSFFYPQLDDFSAMTVHGSGTVFTTDVYKTVQVSVTVSSNGKNHTSPVRLYKDTQHYNGLYTTIFTALVNLRNGGEVCNVAWDDDCSQCDKSECLGGQQVA